MVRKLFFGNVLALAAILLPANLLSAQNSASQTDLKEFERIIDSETGHL